jgi:hypothetical protein
MDKKTGRKYHDVGTMDRQPWNTDVDPESRLVPESVVPGMVLDAEGWGMTCQSADDNDEPCTAPATINLQDILMEYEVGEDPYEKGHLGEINEFYCKKHYEEDGYDSETKGSEHHKGQGYDDELDESLGMSHKESGMKQSFKDRRDESKGTEKFDHSRAYSRVKAMDAEGAKDYIFGYDNVLAEKVANERYYQEDEQRYMDELRGLGHPGDKEQIRELSDSIMRREEAINEMEYVREDLAKVTLGADSAGDQEVPVVPDPSSFPSGYGRVLGQQTDQANLSPLHAEGDDVQMVKIQDPVMTGAKMALGVVALNATAIASAALIGLAIAHTARREE